MNVRDLPSALEHQHAICETFGHHPPALFLDYDGTLTPIVARPEDARLSNEVRDILASLAARCAAFVVSGRDRSVVQQLVGLEALGYVGCHGFDIAGPAGSAVRHEVATERLPVIEAAARALGARLAGVPGAIVERKRFTVAVHVRLVAPDWRGHVEDIVREVSAELPGLRLERGKAVFEVYPDVAWDKGAAVGWLLRATPLAEGVPVYIGDDLTDETAFAALAHRGVGIIVSEDDRPTAARFRLRNPSEVAQFLAGLLARLSR